MWRSRSFTISRPPTEIISFAYCRHLLSVCLIFSLSSHMSNINIELVVNWSQIWCPFGSRMNRLGDGGLVGWWSMVGCWSIPSFKVYSKIWRAGGRWWAGGQSPHQRIFENLVGCMNKWWADGQFIHLRYVRKFGGLTVVGQNAFTQQRTDFEGGGGEGF